jgi:hypothetical protein
MAAVIEAYANWYGSKCSPEKKPKLPEDEVAEVLRAAIDVERSQPESEKVKEVDDDREARQQRLQRYSNYLNTNDL